MPCTVGKAGAPLYAVQHPRNFVPKGTINQGTSGCCQLVLKALLDIETETRPLS